MQTLQEQEGGPMKEVELPKGVAEMIITTEDYEIAELSIVSFAMHMKKFTSVDGVIRAVNNVVFN